MTIPVPSSGRHTIVLVLSTATTRPTGVTVFLDDGDARWYPVDWDDRAGAGIARVDRPASEVLGAGPA
ncbi:MAG: hypothetical protein AB7L84_09180 [Acidimicrobiia bacterium]